MNFIRSIYTSLFYKVIISCSFVLGLTLLIRLVPSLSFDGISYKNKMLVGLIDKKINIDGIDCILNYKLMEELC